jgi:hypothetical protein
MSQLTRNECAGKVLARRMGAAPGNSQELRPWVESVLVMDGGIARRMGAAPGNSQELRPWLGIRFSGGWRHRTQDGCGPRELSGTKALAGAPV